jgi:transcription-repair coupling factor (superfamily II helicase)
MKKKVKGEQIKSTTKNFTPKLSKIKTSFKRLASYTEISQGMQKKGIKKIRSNKKKTNIHTASNLAKVVRESFWCSCEISFYAECS